MARAALTAGARGLALGAARSGRWWRPSTPSGSGSRRRRSTWASGRSAWSSSSTRWERSARRCPAGSPTGSGGGPSSRAGCAVALLGVLLTLPPWWPSPSIVAGFAALSIGFFVIHGLASGWIAARAHAAGVGTGQAAAFYLFSYYVGSSVFGTLGGHAWSVAGWVGVVALTGTLLLVCCALALTLRRIPPLI